MLNKTAQSQKQDSK